MDQVYRTEILKLKSGERMPFMVDYRTEMPVGAVTLYSLIFHRGKPINTTLRSVKAISILHSWADSRSIDLVQRFTSGNLFTTNEISSLSEVCWIRWDKKVVKGKGVQPTGTSVVAPTHAFRLDSIREYINWRTSTVTSQLDVGNSRLQNVNARLKQINEQIKSLQTDSESIPRGQLTEEECQRLMEIVSPKSPLNPFKPQTQLRNYVLLLLYYELGIRKGEALVLKSHHIKLGPKSFITITFTPDDAVDPRKLPPSLKTRSRTLPLSRRLSSLLARLLKERLADPRTRSATRNTPFVFTSSKTGNPLSLDAIQDIFALIRERYPNDFPKDFGAHHLRKTWNYRFSQECRLNGFDEKESEKLRKYVMGWSKTSQQASVYNIRDIEEMAMKVMLSLQDKLLEDSQW